MALTHARELIIRSATLYPPAAWVVSATGHRVGWERVSWKKNCLALCELGFLRANAHGDYYLTDAGEEMRDAILSR